MRLHSYRVSFRIFGLLPLRLFFFARTLPGDTRNIMDGRDGLEAVSPAQKPRSGDIFTAMRATHPVQPRSGEIIFASVQMTKSR